jgi:hypothetical protein
MLYESLSGNQVDGFQTETEFRTYRNNQETTNTKYKYI